MRDSLAAAQEELSARNAERSHVPLESASGAGETELQRSSEELKRAHEQVKALKAEKTSAEEQVGRLLSVEQELRTEIDRLRAEWNDKKEGASATPSTQTEQGIHAQLEESLAKLQAAEEDFSAKEAAWEEKLALLERSAASESRDLKQRASVHDKLV